MKNIIIKLINFLANTILLLIIALVAELLAINNLIQAQRGYYDDWSQLKDCNRPLGLIDGRIHDWQLSDSSSNNHHQKDPNCNTRYARIHQWPGRGWCPNPNSTYNYLQIDLGYETAINGLVTQGRADGKSWIRSYRLMFSTDANQWHYYNQKQTVLANRDSHSLQYYLLADLQVTRFVRLEVLTWHSNYPGLRVELLGCRRCDTVINYPPRTVYKASSSRTWPQDAYCAPENAYIDGSVGWCAKWNNQNQWLAVDLGPPTKIVGVVTRGTGAPFRRHWVTSYSISYSNDSLRWTYYKDDTDTINLTTTTTSNAKKFDANMDKETKRWHYFGQPFVARYVRFNVLTWRTRIAMRVGVIGCLFDGQCPDGFFRVNNYSECVPNLAYHRSTWINDKRHSWTHWEFGNSNYAVDGISGNSGGADTSADDYDQQHQQQSTTMQKCALLDNYFVETPVWMVDLAETVPIHGVVIVSWPHHYIDNNIERLTIAYDKSAKFITTTTTTAGGGGGGAVNQTLSATGIGGGGGGGGHHSLKTCARIGADQLRRSSRIHVTCDTHAVARYVYIIGFGVDKHSRHLFSAILCEVYVY